MFPRRKAHASPSRPSPGPSRSNAAATTGAKLASASGWSSNPASTASRTAGIAPGRVEASSTIPRSGPGSAPPRIAATAALVSSGRSIPRSAVGSARSRPRTASAPTVVRPRSNALANDGRLGFGAAWRIAAIDSSRSEASASRNQPATTSPHAAGLGSPRQASRSVAWATRAARASGISFPFSPASSHQAGFLGRTHSSASPVRPSQPVKSAKARQPSGVSGGAFERWASG